MFMPTVIDRQYRHLCGQDKYKICILDFDVTNVLHNFTETWWFDLTGRGGNRIRKWRGNGDGYGREFVAECFLQLLPEQAANRPSCKYLGRWFHGGVDGGVKLQIMRRLDEVMTDILPQTAIIRRKTTFTTSHRLSNDRNQAASINRSPLSPKPIKNTEGLPCGGWISWMRIACLTIPRPLHPSIHQLSSIIPQAGKPDVIHSC